MSFEKFQYTVSRLIGSNGDRPGFTRLSAGSQLDGDDEGPVSAARNLNASFLIALAGPGHAKYAEAIKCIDDHLTHPQWDGLAEFFRVGLFLVEEEVRKRLSEDRTLAEDLDSLVVWLTGTDEPDIVEAAERYHRLLFPEGADLHRARESKVDELRTKRLVRITALNPEPLTSVYQQVLFTANALLTVPLMKRDLEAHPLSDAMREGIGRISSEDQRFWYDHPIPIGIECDRNEAVYGIRALEEALRYEIERGNMPAEGRIPFLLSVSVTHEGLHRFARDYLEDEFARGGEIRHIDAYVVTEDDTRELLHEVLIPAGERYLRRRDYDTLRQVFGVDGRYGRHYSFLKAVAALWQVLIRDDIRATFKIDLDQVFPQKELIAETGKSAFEHLMTSLWGAHGVDWNSEHVELGMIAGALVNEADIGKGLFTPDVPWPSTSASTSTPTPTVSTLAPDQWVFCSSLPQAMSTEAEMMTRYGSDGPDGETECLQRVHVTGGTCGILVDSIRRHRPFTPTFISRAEDQAYMMSVLFADGEPTLRYVHESGLIMRHDKEAFAADAIEEARLGKLTGDFERILIYTSYARSLPWGVDRIKDLLDPFTGCFVSRIPLTVTWLRMALKAASLFSSRDPGDIEDAAELLKLSNRRLLDLANRVSFDPYPLSAEYWKEKEGWDIYYDILDEMEKALDRNDQYVLDLRGKARKMVEGWKLELCKPGDR